ncbi:ankyrin repeat domain-containing protein 50-like [Mytilus trossulus]|uniref:ankyrin repeat domain-containing protein 50-like n=1 Tax=Mytilus trossulus TaxID=6551 RepID=UPI003005B17F
MDKCQEKEMLLKAVAQGQIKLVKLLIDGGVDVNFQGYDGKTPLIVACSFVAENKDSDSLIVLINLLLKSGAYTNAQDMKGRTPLMYAVRHCLSIDIIQLLLDSDADPTILDNNRRSMLHYMKRKCLPKYRCIFKKYMASELSSRSHYEQRYQEKEMLLKAVAQQKIKLVKLLMDGGVDVNFQGYDGKTPLIVACSFVAENKNSDSESLMNLINLLIKGGADTNAHDMKGRTPLMYAVRHFLSTDIIQLLLDNGANPTVLDNNGRNTLHYIKRKCLPYYRCIFQRYLSSEFKSHNHELQIFTKSPHNSTNRLISSQSSFNIEDNIFRRASDSTATCRLNKLKLPKRKCISYSNQSAIINKTIPEEKECDEQALRPYEKCSTAEDDKNPAKDDIRIIQMNEFTLKKKNESNTLSSNAASAKIYQFDKMEDKKRKTTVDNLTCKRVLKSSFRSSGNVWQGISKIESKMMQAGMTNVPVKLPPIF